MYFNILSKLMHTKFYVDHRAQHLNNSAGDFRLGLDRHGVKLPRNSNSVVWLKTVKQPA